MAYLWQDRRGCFSALRAGTLTVLASPALAILYFALTDDLGPRPVTETIHEAGLWCVRFLMLALFVTPIRRIARYPLLVEVRRMIGVAAFLYIALHLVLYIVDQSFDFAHVASEIVLRIYLTIGFTAWIGLAVLAATSNDYMVRRLGGVRWRHLHWLVYPIGVFALIHYFMQSKLDVFEPTVVAGLFGWMMLYRFAHWTLPDRWRTAQGEFPVWAIGLLGVMVALGDFLFEAVGYRLVYHASVGIVLAADFDFSDGIRPGWYVLAGGVIVTLVGLWRLRPAARQTAASTSAGRTAS